MDATRKKYDDLFLALIVLLDCVFTYYFVFSPSDANPYILRDIDRAAMWLQGLPVWVGPDFSSGTYIPGPGFYFLIAPALLISSAAPVVIGYLLALGIAIQTVFSRYFSKVLQISPVAIYLLISSSFFIYKKMIWPTNATILYPLCLLAVLCIHKYYTNSNDNSRWFWITAFLVAGLPQIHFSAVLLWPFFILTIHFKGKQQSSNLKQIRKFILAIGISLIPFAIGLFKFWFLKSADAPVFAFNDLGSAAYLQHSYLRDLSKFINFRSKVNERFEALVLFAYVICRTPFVLKSNRQQIEKYFLITMVAILLIQLPFILSPRAIRYLTVPFTLSLLYVCFDLRRFFQKHLLATKYQWALVILCVFSQRAYSANRSMGLYKTSHCELCLTQLQGICDHFNSQKVSFDQVAGNSYEVWAEDNEGSLAAAAYCFDQKKSTEPVTHKKHYVLIYENFVSSPEKKQRIVQNFPAELESVYHFSQMNLEATVNGVLIYSRDISDTDTFYKRLSNFTYPYEIDPAVGASFVQKDLGPSSQLQLTSICSAPLFCDVFINSSYQDKQLRVVIKSRVLQTKYELGPYAGRIENPVLNITCDGQPQKIALVSSLGTESGHMQNRTFFTPLEISTSLQCEKVILVSLSGSKLIMYSMAANSDHDVQNPEFVLQPFTQK